VIESTPSDAADDGPINILLVDDQPGKLLGYQTILEELGENLLMAQSARSALEILLQNEIALLLVDVVMPELDGFELVEIIRAHPRFEKTAVIFVSGVHLSDLDRVRGYSAGAVDYLPVPIVPELLRAKVRVFADLYRKTRQLESLNRRLEERISARTAELESSTQRWKENEQRLRLALLAARAGAWEWRFDCDEVRWSPELFALLGLPMDGPVPSVAEFLAYVDAGDRERMEALFRSLPASTEQSSFDLDFRFRRPGARTSMWLRAAGEVVADAQGRPILARGIYKDATRRRGAMSKLEVEGRKKDEFLAMLAHELRNPLAPILSCVNMLQTGALTPAAKRRSHDILERQVLHVAKLVDNLLDVSRITRGTIALEPKPTDFAALVRRIVEATLLRGTGHEITSEIPSGGPIVSIDPVRMAQAVTSVLDNATKFTPSGGKISVVLSEDEGEAVLRIADTGIGIAAQNLERVFELFTQVDGGGQGLGIGLALARRLLELQGGSIGVHSDGEALGAEFVLRVPCLPPDSAGLVLERETAPTMGDKRIRFLIVDDNALAADTMAELLELTGYVARAVYSGEAAMKVGEAFEPDIVLLDLGMPKMDGYETAQQLRQTPWGSRARLVAVTGWGDASDRKKTAEAGFDGHFVKPVDLDAVVKFVESMQG
jgi:signal transduction histidine kinase/CheY-like chemotaxis protein